MVERQLGDLCRYVLTEFLQVSCFDTLTKEMFATKQGCQHAYETDRFADGSQLKSYLLMTQELEVAKVSCLTQYATASCQSCSYE